MDPRWFSKTSAFFFALSLIAFAPALAFGQSITIQGHVENSSGVAVNGASTQFRVQILTPDSSRCVLYDETRIVDLSQSNGFFSLNLNDGTGTVNSPTTYSLEQAISNRTGFSVNSSYCASGSGTVAYSPAATDNRKVVIQFRDPGSMSGFETIPEMDLNPLPYAIEARSTGGFPASSLLRFESVGGPASVSSLSPANFTELLALLNGTSNNYMSASGSSPSGARLPTYAGNPSLATTGSMWFDTSSGSGVLKYKDSSGTIQTLGSGGGGGTITSITAAGALTGGGSSGAVTVSLPTTGVTGFGSAVGSASSVPVITYDSYGRLTSVSTAAISGTLPSGTAGEFLKYSSGAWGSAAVRMSDIKNATGAAALFGSTTCAASESFYWDSGTDQFKCQSIALGAPSSTVAATYAKVTVATDGRVNGGSATIGNSDIADLAWSKLTGVPNLVTNGGSASSIVANNSGSKPTGQVAGRIYVDISNQKISYDDGTAWVDVSGSASATPSVSVSAPLTNTSGTVGITQASTSTNGYLSSADWNTFSGKLSSALNSALIWVGDGSNVATPVAPSGNVSLDNAGKFTVTGIRDQNISGAGTNVGQVLRYSATNTWVPEYLTMKDLRSTVTGTQALTSSCTAGKTLYWDSGTDSLGCQDISIAASTQITGQLPIANGGTGTNSAGQNLVFAGPSSGAGAPAFRALAASDLPAEAKLWAEGSGNINRTSGYVGIGTASPTAKLHVVGSDNETLRVESSNTMSTTIELINSSTGAHTYQFYTTGSGNGSGPGLFGVYDATANRTPLSISGATNLITTNANGGFGWSSAPVYADSAADTLLSRAAPGVIEINNGTAGTTRDLKVRALNPGGANLGLGLTSAADKLSIAALAYGNNQDGGVRLQSPAGEWVGRFAMKSDSGGSARMAIEAPANAAGGSNEAISIKIGNVGLGTTNPTVALDVGSHTDAIRLPAGTAAQQPGQASMPAAANGMIRYNTTSNSLEAYVNGAWTNLATVGGTQSFAGNVSVGGTFTSTGAATFNGGATIAGGALNMSSQNITGVGSSITAAGALGINATGAANGITLNSGTSGAVNAGSANGTSLSVLSPAASSVNYVTVKGAVAGASPVIGTGGSDTNIDLTFSPKGTGRTIFSSGNVGIGTYSPYSPLHVVYPYAKTDTTLRPTFTLTSNEAANPFKFYVGMTGAAALANRLALIQTGDDGISNGGNLALQPYAGYVGIGTSTPTTTLHVQGAQNLFSGNASFATGLNLGRAVAEAAVGVAANAGDWSYISTTGDAVVRSTSNNLILSALNGSGDIKLTTGATDTAKMTIKNSGFVGIATATPQAPLHVQGAAGGGETLRLSNGTGSEGGQISLMDGTGAGAWEIDNAGSGPTAAFRIFRDKGVNNSTGLVMNSSGNVGIGTSGPNEALEVAAAAASSAGRIIASNGAGGSRKATLISSPSTAANYGRIEAYDYGTPGGLPLVFNSVGGGNVGIGTSDPQGALHVVSSGISYFDRIPMNVTTGSHLYLRSGNGTMAAPTKVLNAQALGTLSFGGYDGASWVAQLYAGLQGVASEDWSATNKGSRLYLNTIPNGSTTAATRMTVDQNGYVGIGNTTPQSKLHLTGPGDGLAAFKISDTNNPGIELRSSSASSTATPYIDFAIGSTSDAGVGAPDWSGRLLYNPPNAPNGFAFYVPSSASPGVLIDAAGSMGVGGVTGLNDVLEVNGYIRSKGIRGRTGIGGTAQANLFNFHWTGSSAQLWVDSSNVGNIGLSSDRRLKKDIQSLEKAEGLDALAKLRPVSFHWRLPEDDPSKQLGFIAQEVETVFPNLVKTGMKTELAPDGIRRVEHIGLIAPIVKAIQEIREWMLGTDARVKALEAQNEAKARELAQVKAKNDALTAYLCEKDPKAPFCRH